MAPGEQVICLRVRLLPAVLAPFLPPFFFVSVHMQSGFHQTQISLMFMQNPCVLLSSQLQSNGTCQASESKYKLPVCRDVYIEHNMSLISSQYFPWE